MQVERSAVATVSKPVTPTEAEQLFRTFLAACGEVAVSDNEKFAREVQDWLTYRVREVARIENGTNRPS